MSTIRDPAYITDAGRTMMTAGGDVTYTKAVLYGQDISHLTSDQVKALTTIGNPLKEVKVGISDKQNTDRGTTVILEATFQNDNLKADLPYSAVGFFAQKGNDEKLIAVAVANAGAYLTATSPDGVATDALDLKLAIAIGDATNVTATVDPAGSVTPATLNGAINQVTHDLTAQIDTKADSTDLDKTNTEVAKKADSEDVKTQVDTVSKSITDLSNMVSANKDATDKALATKADQAAVTDQISKQVAQINTALDTKVTADYSYSKAELDKKLLDLTTDTNGKVDAGQVSTMIEGKADKADVDKQIKAVNDVVATKADKATVDAEISKIDFTPYAKTVDVDAKIRDVKNTAKQAADSLQTAVNQINNTRLPLYQGGDNEDLKGYFDAQIRMYSGNGGVKNIPSDSQYQSSCFGTLIVLPDGINNKNDGTLLWISPESKMWIAQSNGRGASSWSAWTRIATSTDVTALQNSINGKGITLVKDFDIATKQSKKVNRESWGANNDYPDYVLSDQALYPFADAINQLMPTSQCPALPDGFDLNSSFVGWRRATNRNLNNAPDSSWETDSIYFQGEIDNGDGRFEIGLNIGSNESDSPRFAYRIYAWKHWKPWKIVANDESIANLQNQINGKLNTTDFNSRVNISGQFFRMLDNASDWNAIFGVPNGNNVLTSLRINGTAPGTLLNNFSAGVGFGGGDTKGVLTVAYGDHQARITGGNGSAPVWSEDIAWKSDISNLLNQLNQQAQTIQSLTTRLTNAENEINYIKANYVEGRNFPASQEAQATSWENANPQRIAFITK